MASLYGHCYTAWLRLKQRLKGGSVFDILKELEEEQFLPVTQLQELQLNRLNTLLLHATNRSSFYQKRFGNKPPQLASIVELSELPLLTRDDLQENYKSILVPGDPTTYTDSSGGSTGNPVNFYHDGRYKEYADALELLFLSWMDILPGDSTAAFWGADRDFADLSFKERLAQRVKRSLVLNSFDVTESGMCEYLDRLQKIAPDYVIGYASSLALAAEIMVRRGGYSFRPRAVRSSAEMLYPAQRETITRAFGTPVYNFYGSREISHLAAECAEHNGLHIFASGRIVEVCDANGRPVPDGELGYLVVTDLTNFAFPFIRYNIGDMAIKAHKGCPCGRTYPLIKELGGRSTDILFVGGRHIHGEFFTHLFYGRPEVRQFQVVQETADNLRVKIVPRETEFDTTEIERLMRRKAGGDVKIQFEFVDRIAPQKSGKYRFTINHITSNKG
jgi:phenylacetate-CoA ligase